MTQSLLPAAERQRPAVAFNCTERVVGVGHTHPIQHKWTASGHGRRARHTTGD
eukprot:ctg_2667.g451